jgi:hypothetical protein
MWSPALQYEHYNDGLLFSSMITSSNENSAWLLSNSSQKQNNVIWKFFLVGQKNKKLNLAFLASVAWKAIM